MQPGQHIVGNLVASTPSMAKALNAIFVKAAITGRPDIKAWIATGNLPAGSQITSAVFQRALLALGTGWSFKGEDDDTAADSGV
jgi:hypothetical protein